jgi:hypothetical protein
MADAFNTDIRAGFGIGALARNRRSRGRRLLSGAPVRQGERLSNFARRFT